MKFTLVLAVFVLSLPICSMAISDSRVDEHTMVLLTCDEGVGDVAEDLSGRGNHGEITGAKWVEGVSGTALEFENPADGVLMPASDDLDLTEELTIEAWINPASLAARGDPISKHQQAGYGVLLIDAKATPTHHIAGGWVFGASDTVLEEGQWYYVATTYDGDSIKTYINGELDGETNAPGEISHSEAGLGLGGVPRDPSMFPFFGVIDEFRVSNIVRTEEEIRAAMDSETAKSVDPSGKLTITWASIKTQF